MEGLRRAGCLVAALLLGGCAQWHKPLTAENRAKVRQLDVRIVVPQETFFASAQAPGISMYTGGGLIPALIDAGIQQSRQKDMAQSIAAVAEGLFDCDFRQEAGRVVADAARATWPFALRSAVVVPAMPPRKEQQALIAATRADDAYLLVLMSYAVEPGLDAFTLRTSAQLWQAGQSEHTYRGMVVQQMPLASRTRSEALAALGRDRCAAMGGLMQASVAETLRLIALDTGPPGVADTKRTASLRAGPTVVPVVGTLVADDAQRLVVRDGSGALVSIEKAVRP